MSSAVAQPVAASVGARGNAIRTGNGHVKSSSQGSGPESESQRKPEEDSSASPDATNGKKRDSIATPTVNGKRTGESKEEDKKAKKRRKVNHGKLPTLNCSSRHDVAKTV